MWKTYAVHFPSAGLSAHKCRVGTRPRKSVLSDYLLSIKSQKSVVNISQVCGSETQWWRLTFTTQSLWLMHLTPSEEGCSSRQHSNWGRMIIILVCEPLRLGHVTDRTANCQSHGHVTWSWGCLAGWLDGWLSERELVAFVTGWEGVTEGSAMSAARL